MDAERKRILKRQARRNERADMRARMPISVEAAQLLFNNLDLELGKQPCKHDLRLTIAFFGNQLLDSAPALAWLREIGGYCDCEVLSSLRDTLEELRKI